MQRRQGSWLVHGTMGHFPCLSCWIPSSRAGIAALALSLPPSSRSVGPMSPLPHLCTQESLEEQRGRLVAMEEEFLAANPGAEIRRLSAAA